MNKSCKRSCARSCTRDLVAVVCLLGLAAIAGVSALLTAGCSASAAFPEVAQQNAANTQVYAANVSTLSAAATALARAESEAMLRRARERVSQDLTRLRATITPGDPTDAELSDPGAGWTRSLIAEAAALTTRINSAPPADRAAIATSLATDHPATIDLAIGTPGFTPSRILREANDLDRINATIERETNAAIRAGLLVQRYSILNNYLPVRNAAESAARFNTAIASLITTIDEQGRILGLHARAMKSYATGNAATSSAIGTFRDPELRTAILQLITDTSGDRAADQVRERLRRIDDATSAFETARR